MNRFAIRLLLAALLPLLPGTVAGGQSAATKAGVPLVAARAPATAVPATRQPARAVSASVAPAATEVAFNPGRSTGGRERILKLYDGLSRLFSAATNGNPQARAELSVALRSGIVVQTNLVAAYAWLELAAEQDASLKPELDGLVVQLDADEVLQAQELARQYQSGHWPTDLARMVDEKDPRLAFEGITISGRKSLLVVNHATVGAGETVRVEPANSPGKAGDPLTITCLEFGPDYALIAVAGESHLKLLSTGLSR